MLPRVFLDQDEVEDKKEDPTYAADVNWPQESGRWAFGMKKGPVRWRSQRYAVDFGLARACIGRVAPRSFGNDRRQVVSRLAGTKVSRA